MVLISAFQIGKSFTSRPLFQNLTFSIEQGERCGLIGPNGAGKSTLLRILAGKSEIDQGQLSIKKGLKVGFLEQVPNFSSDATILSSAMEGVTNPEDWEEIAVVQEILSKVGLSQLDPDKPVTQLSGGWKKRVALARELSKSPDILLLDEPTNHLDTESILWLEEFLARAPFGTITITHDRMFLQKVSNRIIEIDPRHKDGLLSVNGTYADFLEVRDDQLSAQKTHETKLKNTLRRETEWLRRGAKARQTKQQARIQAAQELKENVNELSERNRERKVRLDFQGLEKNPKKLIEAKGISKSYGKNAIVPTLDLLIGPKSRIGLMGRNGSGKSTLIKLLTKLEEPDSGSVFHAERLKVSYFEQNRETLDPRTTVIKTICPAGDQVNFAGTWTHAKSYLSRFLFGYDQMDSEVGKLSGGEQSRLLLAKLMLQEANLLVLDEPTNDLDIATLDVLCDVLSEFKGAIILVTHDRYFLDQVANKILAFGINEFDEPEVTSMAGLEQWEDWQEDQLKLKSRISKGSAPNASEVENAKSKRRKLSYKDQRELDSMEETIHTAEAELARLHEDIQDPKVTENPARLREVSEALSRTQEKVEKLYARWQELEK